MIVVHRGVAGVVFTSQLWKLKKQPQPFDYPESQNTEDYIHPNTIGINATFHHWFQWQSYINCNRSCAFTM
ncbi:MAG: hypothetical protein C5S47_06020 [Candidatus Methanogasteraceae archaeon]|nr:MAG: hypothetical protein C5S47_06020 [ANME-2 cluster archaeon]